MPEKCQICGINDADISTIFSDGENEMKISICFQCLKKMQDDISGKFSPLNKSTDLNNAFKEELKNDKGKQLKMDELMLQAKEQDSVNKEKILSFFESDNSKLAQVLRLKRELNYAIDLEKYEVAAELRDKLKKIRIK